MNTDDAAFLYLSLSTCYHLPAMPDRDVLIFANPIAGRGRGRPIAAHLARSLRNAG